MEINLNDYIVFRPNEYALECLKKKQREFYQLHGMDVYQERVNKLEQAVLTGEEYRVQLHEFAHMWGEFLYLGAPMIMETANVRIERTS